MNDQQALAVAALIIADHAPIRSAAPPNLRSYQYWCASCVGENEYPTAGEFQDLDEWAEHVVAALWPDMVKAEPPSRRGLLARSHELWMQFWDNPFTMFDRSKPDRDHNTMTGLDLDEAEQ
ncbi:hypothetical protein RND64_04520 [Gordonia sp. w5E2]|uniref:hypothetical protein n=1 Tax=Gordonia sp. w5E2 TaxID=3075837 RepID=UPI002F40927D